VNDTLRNSFSGKVSELVNKVEVGQNNRAIGTCSHGVLVVIDGMTLGVRNGVLLHLAIV
jgi:hypothetical protein